uniref:Testis development related protein n=1 Tax=Esox lucius TaxID=8010 RepID=A0A3P8YKI8_ESOLU
MTMSLSDGASFCSCSQVNDAEMDMSPVQEEEGPSAVSQLAKRMQGAGAKGWNRMSALFNREDEHQLLDETETPPVADHPLAAMPEEPQRPTRPSGFWGSFANNWKQMAATRQGGENSATPANETGPTVEGHEVVGEGGGGSNNIFSKYASLGGGSENTSFKWNFVTSKLADLKTKSMADYCTNNSV